MDINKQMKGRIIYSGIRNDPSKCSIFQVNEKSFQSNKNQIKCWELIPENLQKYANDPLTTFDNFDNNDMTPLDFSMSETDPDAIKLNHLINQMIEKSNQNESFTSYFIKKNWGNHLLNCDVLSLHPKRHYIEKKSSYWKEKQGYFKGKCLVCDRVSLCIVTNNNLTLNMNGKENELDSNSFKFPNNINLDDESAISNFVFHFSQSILGFNLLNNNKMHLNYCSKIKIACYERIFNLLKTKFKMNISLSRRNFMELPFDGIEIFLETNYTINNSSNMLSTYIESEDIEIINHRINNDDGKLILRVAEIDIENIVNIILYAIDNFKLLTGGQLFSSNIYFKSSYCLSENLECANLSMNMKNYTDDNGMMRTKPWESYRCNHPLFLYGQSIDDLKFYSMKKYQLPRTIMHDRLPTPLSQSQYPFNFNSNHDDDIFRENIASQNSLLSNYDYEANSCSSSSNNINIALPKPRKNSPDIIILDPKTGHTHIYRMTMGTKMSCPLNNYNNDNIDNSSSIDSFKCGGSCKRTFSMKKLIQSTNNMNNNEIFDKLNIILKDECYNQISVLSELTLDFLKIEILITRCKDCLSNFICDFCKNKHKNMNCKNALCSIHVELTTIGNLSSKCGICFRESFLNYENNDENNHYLIDMKICLKCINFFKNQ